MRIIHTVASLSKACGGPSRSVVSLVDHLSGISDLYITLLTQKPKNDQIVIPRSSTVEFRAIQSSNVLRTKLAKDLARYLGNLGRAGVAIVHGHGIWDAASTMSAWLARRYCAPFVLHPRGMLEPWSLNHKAFKKKVAMYLYQGNVLRHTDLFVATSMQELESIRALGLRQPVAVIPNGIDFPFHNGDRPHKSTKPLQALFLSRIHPKKGLLNLVRAWAQVRPDGWRLVIAGPDEGGHWREVKREIEKLDLVNDIRYVGSVDGDAKANLYLSSDLFVLPTFSENFGLVVAEALAYGLPVVTTKGAPWKDLEDFRCGWWVDIGVGPLVSVLRHATSLSGKERKAMGARGRAYVQRYDWRRIAEQTVMAYRWLAGLDPKPGYVFNN